MEEEEERKLTCPSFLPHLFFSVFLSISVFVSWFKDDVNHAETQSQSLWFRESSSSSFSGRAEKEKDMNGNSAKICADVCPHDDDVQECYWTWMIRLNGEWHDEQGSDFRVVVSFLLLLFVSVSQSACRQFVFPFSALLTTPCHDPCCTFWIATTAKHFHSHSRPCVRLLSSAFAFRFISCTTRGRFVCSLNVLCMLSDVFFSDSCVCDAAALSSMHVPACGVICKSGESSLPYHWQWFMLMHEPNDLYCSFYSLPPSSP